LAASLSTALVLPVIARIAVTFWENHRFTIELKTDALTGLGNRGKLIVDLRAALLARSPHSLVILDLDGFKTYNDTFGHPADDSVGPPVGADLWVRLANRFADSLAQRGSAYRLGGDEFAALVAGSSEEGVNAAVTAAAALSERGVGFHVTSSFGVSEFPREAS